MTTRPTVTRLDTPIHDGDWHDAPLRWTVQGPGKEVQNFATVRDAKRYATLRSKFSFRDAVRLFARS